ncbi:mitochondrial protein [Coprinopsis cinerea okayama7|uniref:trimethyllysine dioxygenase n=1 Tax=Coprinopsis cinerea (strain Okayama-7 / 130 / ATCC MYA-4618 / FGSC 9003) TaxID=240176 RepID=A8NTG2_COPC7|nr:mitochondrial protein [Coprinopsis cinerea okayama7\|eukprot:XP_001836221.1 mitochondrial protein [Coprinopsis cinerea okayama7\
MLRASRILRGPCRPLLRGCAPVIQGSYRSRLVSPVQAKGKTPSHSRLLATVAQAAAEAQRPQPEAASEELPIVSSDEKQVAVGWDTRTWSRFHNIWLRDHCRCPKCFHHITKQRLQSTFEIPADIAPLRVEPKAEGLEVVWNSSDNHTSLYPWTWLRANSYDPPLKEKRPDETEKILWGSKIEKAPPTVAYEEVMQSDAGLFKWLSNIDRFGFSFVSGVPATPEATEELSEKIGFIRETQYGKFWDFTSDLAKGDTAYTTLALGAHTDNTYFTDPCGLQLFHLLSHTEGTGGSTLLVDGFYVASILKELNPSAYRLLSTIPVPAHAAGEPDCLYRPSPFVGYPTLGHDPWTKELVQVRWNNDDRSVMSHLEPSLVEEWYEAIRLWNQCLKSPDSEYWVQLTPGTAVVVDNHRVLHGRSSFSGKRRMCGAYIGVDEYRSKLAVLSEKYAPDTVLRATEALPDTVVNGRNIWNLAL